MQHHPLHERALKVSRIYHRAEGEMIDILIEAYQIRLHEIYKCPNLFAYVEELLGFSPSVTYAFIAVAKKSAVCPELHRAIHEKRLTVSTANRMVAHLTLESVDELIHFAESRSRRDLEKKLAGLETAKSGPLKNLKVSEATLFKLKRVREMEAEALNPDEALDLVLTEYLKRHDPLEKAQRSEANRAKTESAERSAKPLEGESAQAPEKAPAALPAQNPVPEHAPETLCARKKRMPLNTAQKSRVLVRDEGRCCFRFEDGRRCEGRKWLDTHHVIPVSRGGSNDPQNLTTLCRYHHGITHGAPGPRERSAHV